MAHDGSSFHPTPRGWAGPNLLATVLFESEPLFAIGSRTMASGRHQPLNRQAERYAREGVELGLSTLADQLGGERLHGDDTPVPVLAKGKTDTGRLWVYVRDDRPFAGGAQPAALYRFSRDRRGEHPLAHLAGWSGILQADAYAGLGELYAADRQPGPITGALCWSNARRKLFELADVAASARPASRRRRSRRPRWRRSRASTRYSTPSGRSTSSPPKRAFPRGGPGSRRWSPISMRGFAASARRSRIMHQSPRRGLHAPTLGWVRRLPRIRKNLPDQHRCRAHAARRRSWKKGLAVRGFRPWRRQGGLISGLQQRVTTDAARIGGVGLQIVRDWVLRFNAEGPSGLVDRKAPGKVPTLTAEQRAGLARGVEAGPEPWRDGVVRWRRIDLAQWLWEELRVSVSEATVGRDLRALGFRKLSARPRRYARDPEAADASKKVSRSAWRKSAPRIPASAWRSGSKTRPG